MSFLFSRRSAEKSVALDSPGGGVAGGLASLSCNSANANSPGKLRILKSRKATRNSPYGKKRGVSRLGLSSFDSSSWADDDGSSLLEAGHSTSNAWVADKHVGIKVGAGGPSHGLKLITDPVHGVIVSGIDRAGQAAQNGLLVGDIVHAIDGTPVTSHLGATTVLDSAAAGRRLTLTATGSTRALTMDKTKGDLGMTCCALPHSSRGVLLKRIAKGSLADADALYCGDTIVSVNEQLVGSHEQAVQLMNACKSEVRLVMLGQSSEVTLGQGGEVGITLADHESATDGPGVKVLRVEAGGLAAQAGISSGDTLLSANGVICLEHAQAMAVLQDKTKIPKGSAGPKLVFMNKYGF